MAKRDNKVTPIRQSESEAPQDREERIQQGGRSVGQSSEGRSTEDAGEQGISNRDVQEENARQAKVMPFREEGTAGKRNKTGGRREVS